MPNYDLVVVGAGIAGMTAAIGAAREGIKKILIIEKENSVGGIINQCIHNGFGDKFVGNIVTGPEYVEFVKNQVNEFQVEILLNTTVLEVTKEKEITYVNPQDGIKDIKAKTIIFAMGSREKYLECSIMNTNGLTGVFTVGEAHKIINLEGYLPGKRTIITAKNKWGFIVARRLIIEGGQIEGVVLENSFEEMADNEIRDIIDGFHVPIIENSRVMEIEGKARIEKVKIINLINKTENENECDSLLLSVGFLPEISIFKNLDINIDGKTFGPNVTDFETSIDGFFACGNIIYGENALKMEETDGINCGVKAAQYIKKVI